MTPAEYRVAIKVLSNDVFRKFEGDLGGEHRSREQRVREFADNPELEARICYLLGLKTEAEKLTEAALSSAEAARTSASTARIAVVVSVLAFIASIVALFAARSAW